jgi:hypothetical protein
LLVRSRAALRLQIPALRHQLAGVNRSHRPRCRLTTESACPHVEQLALDAVGRSARHHESRGTTAVCADATPSKK